MKRVAKGVSPVDYLFSFQGGIMYKVNNYIIYKKEVCKILEILPNYFKNHDYYLLTPISDNTLTIKVPTTNKEIRSLITKKEVEEIIKKNSYHRSDKK